MGVRVCLGQDYYDRMYDLVDGCGAGELIDELGCDGEEDCVDGRDWFSDGW